MDDLSTFAAERLRPLLRVRQIRAFADLVVPYPTLAEIGKRAAIDYFTPGLTSPWVRRIIAWLRIFG